MAKQAKAVKSNETSAASAASVKVLIGGTNEKPEYTDAAEAPRIRAADLTSAAGTLRALALNFLAGTVDSSITRDCIPAGNRDLRHQRAFLLYWFKGVEAKRFNTADLRAAWEEHCDGLTKYRQPSLQTLRTVLRQYMGDEAKPVPEVSGSSQNGAPDATETAAEQAAQAAGVIGMKRDAVDEAVSALIALAGTTKAKGTKEELERIAALLNTGRIGK